MWKAKQKWSIVFSIVVCVLSAVINMVHVVLKYLEYWKAFKQKLLHFYYDKREKEHYCITWAVTILIFCMKIIKL